MRPRTALPMQKLRAYRILHGLMTLYALLFLHLIPAGNESGQHSWICAVLARAIDECRGYDNGIHGQGAGRTCLHVYPANAVRP
jgi:hypothetical protein